MSVLGLMWPHNQLYLSCRPDPAKPAHRLDDLCVIDFPGELPASLVGLLTAVGALGADAKSQHVYEALKTEATNKFTDLLNIVNQNEDAQVLLMDPVDHIALLVSMSTTPTTVQTYYNVLKAIGADVTIVAYPTAAIAGALGRFDPEQPFLFCEWHDDLQLSITICHQNPGHFSRTESRFLLKDVGPRAWEHRIERYLQTTYGIGYTPEVDNVSFLVKADEFRAEIKALIRAMLNGQPSIPLRLKGVHPGAPEPEELSLQLSTEELIQAIEPVLRMARNFVNTRISEFHRRGIRVAVLSGPVSRITDVTEQLRDVLSDIMLIISESDEQQLSTGLHTCVRSRPQLPYDCGVLLKKPGANNGLGTLVLVRPTRIGQQRESEVLELPHRQSDTLEVAFYVRRLNVETAEVVYHIFQKHLFAPRVDVTGRVRLRIAMRVDQGSPDDPSVKVTIDLHDLNAGGTVHFDKLPITDGQPMQQLPLRTPEELDGVEWAAKINTVCNIYDTRSFDVATWRQTLESFGRSRVPRTEYAALLIEVSGLQDAVFAERLQNDAIDPYEFQALGRQAVFWGMYGLANSIRRYYTNCKHTARWLQNYPHDNTPPQEPSCALDFVNALSQDLAGVSGETEIMARARRLHEFYTHTCQQPFNLNIDW